MCGRGVRTSLNRSLETRQTCYLTPAPSRRTHNSRSCSVTFVVLTLSPVFTGDGTNGERCLRQYRRGDCHSSDFSHENCSSSPRV